MKQKSLILEKLRESAASAKAAIMQAIMEKAGAQTEAGAICFSVPVSQVAGLRRLEEDDE